ncbi:hypothetical protein RCO27_08045 [Sphingosinicella sp. LHD-64]|uniref:hypothetical protein n=1 Tax=Sphingosinicella sp. LHD-64 TaxID=3072139 RepID=UPI00280CA2A2|nr:hypothetical protein [Sphingosinicella sp. LHD-64]MDQ8756182.1 hypothetical protein [Sphingosinicella sp. LHD-64]
MIVVQIILSILTLWLLYHLMVWAIPIVTALALGYLALQSGSGWLAAIGVGFLGAALALGIIHLGMACRSLWIRLPIMLAFIGPAAWGGAIAVHSMSIQTGAQGQIWPIVAGAFGGLVFGVLAFIRLIGMTGNSAAPARSVAMAPKSEQQPPEPKVVYYHPIQPVRPRLADARSENGPTIDL